MRVELSLVDVIIAMVAAPPHFNPSSKTVLVLHKISKLLCRQPMRHAKPIGDGCSQECLSAVQTSRYRAS